MMTSLNTIGLWTSQDENVLSGMYLWMSRSFFFEDTIPIFFLFESITYLARRLIPTTNTIRMSARRNSDE